MSAPIPEPTAPAVTKKRSHAARARWKLAVSMLQTYAWGLIGLACLQSALHAHRPVSLWVIAVEMGVALALMALAIWLAPRGEE